MSTKKTPNSNKQWIQSNEGEFQGNITETYNCDFDTDYGVLKTSPNLSAVLTTAEMDETDESPQAFIVFEGRYYLATTDQIHYINAQSDPTTDAWSVDETMSSEDLGDETDMTVYESDLMVTLGTNVMKYDGSADPDWWTTAGPTGAGGPTLTAGVPHPLRVLRSGNDTLFVGNGNLVHYYNADAGVSTVTLESHFTTRCFTPSLDRMWVGTSTEDDDKAFVYEISVGTTTPGGTPIANQSYPVDGRIVFSMFTHKNIPFAITDQGYIQAFNGAEFETVAQFPWADTLDLMEGVRPGAIQDGPRNVAIHGNGVQVRGDFAYIFVDVTNNNSAVNEPVTNGKAGVWVLDLRTYSLTHRYALAGATRTERSGPIFLPESGSTRIMVGTQNLSNEGVVYMEDATKLTAAVVLARHEADSIADEFSRFVIKSDTLDSETVDVKYRNTRTLAAPVVLNDINWLDTTRFTTTDDTTGIQKGYEVFVEEGTGAGSFVHITDISGGTTKTITVDTAIGVAAQSASVRVDDWLKYDESMTSEDGEWKDFGGNEGAHTFSQHKLVLNGDVKLRETICKSNNKEGV